MTSQNEATVRGKILGMVFMGCEPETAALTVGWSEERLKQERENDPEFAADLALREGGAELHHMKNVHKAAEDVKNWRASAWWIARKSAERRERKRGQLVTQDDLGLCIESIVEVIWAGVKNEEDRDRVVVDLLGLLDAPDRDTAVGIAGREEFDELYGKALSATA